MAVVRRVRPEDTASLRDLRLRALQSDPDTFGSSYEIEIGQRRDGEDAASAVESGSRRDGVGPTTHETEVVTVMPVSSLSVSTSRPWPRLGTHGRVHREW